MTDAWNAAAASTSPRIRYQLLFTALLAYCPFSACCLSAEHPYDGWHPASSTARHITRVNWTHHVTQSATHSFNVRFTWFNGLSFSISAAPSWWQILKIQYKTNMAVNSRNFNYFITFFQCSVWILNIVSSDSELTIESTTNTISLLTHVGCCYSAIIQSEK